MHKKSPWKIKSTELIYDNAWISLHHHEVKTPADQDGIYGTVHFKNHAIGIIPLTETNDTYLVGQYRFPLKEYSWEIPMGGGLSTDTHLDSAKRELKEETGIEANDWSELLKIHTSNSVCDESGTIFIAKDLTYGDAEPESTEDLAIKRLPFDEAYKMVMNGEITDSLSVAGILKLKLLQNDHER